MIQHLLRRVFHVPGTVGNYNFRSARVRSLGSVMAATLGARKRKKIISKKLRQKRFGG
jgi:hypothetical protein